MLVIEIANQAAAQHKSSQFPSNTTVNPKGKCNAIFDDTVSPEDEEAIEFFLANCEETSKEHESLIEEPHKAPVPLREYFPKGPLPRRLMKRKVLEEQCAEKPSKKCNAIQQRRLRRPLTPLSPISRLSHTPPSPSSSLIKLTAAVETRRRCSSDEPPPPALSLTSLDRSSLWNSGDSSENRHRPPLTPTLLYFSDRGRATAAKAAELWPPSVSLSLPSGDCSSDKPPRRNPNLHPEQLRPATTPHRTGTGRQLPPRRRCRRPAATCCSLLPLSRLGQRTHTIKHKETLPIQSRFTK
ncbi:uncharacterized protein LOC131008826 [Salvia miltiorrhiza]|uniref:uncharacterized protein LOC131008826 n=1 Tax=Salvia miltiorrhiza TaxID=226208 RepID=UPI0025AD558D|nr:uncharacterized protein LOC131008826 [Salvia miltiorrhiza]